MAQSLERQLSHARAQALQLRGGRLPPEGRPNAVILDSWVRSLQAGLDPAAPLAVPVVAATELAQRREQAGAVRRLAHAELDTLAQQIAGSNFLLAFADHDGVILDLCADNRFAVSGNNAGIVAGSRWHESVCGTSGLGTALATGAPVAVAGLAHHSLHLADITCTAAPVRDAQGRVVGVLNASSYFAARQHHTHALVQMAATQIENGLLLHQMRQQTVLSIHPRTEYLGTLSAGLLAFDAQGLLQALNARAMELLADLTPAPGTAFEALFGAGFDALLGPLPVGAELRLRDVQGRPLVAQLRARPPAAQMWTRPPVAQMWTRPPVAQVLTRPPVAQSVTRPPVAQLRTRPPVAQSRVRPPAQPAQPAALGAGPTRQAAVAAMALAPDFAADDPAVALACRQVQAAVRLAVPILIQGETGSGKELLARHAHRASGRRGEFVAVNCGAIPDELFEAELFGHVGGAFSGARREGSAGLIASAEGGTLLLDEVAELPLHLQSALLRFLDDGLVRPVGGTRTRHINLQLLAASAADLVTEVAARRFRADLMYRLAVVPVWLPPLRQRCDFASAARQVLAALDPSARLTDGAVARLAAQAWPGNFRELRALLTRLLLARMDGMGWVEGFGGVGAVGAVGAEGAVGDVGEAGAGGRWLDEADVQAVLAHAAPVWATPAPLAAGASALQQGADARVRQEYGRCDGNVSQTARNLGISRTTVYRHLRGAASPTPA